MTEVTEHSLMHAEHNKCIKVIQVRLHALHEVNEY